MSTSESKSESIGSEIYSGAASFGKFWTIFGAITGTLISIIFIIFGIYLLLHKTDLVKTSGIVESINPEPCPYVAPATQYQCTLKVKYIINKKEYTAILWYAGKSLYSVGDNIDIYYHSKHPSTSTLDKPIPKWTGWLFIVISLLSISLLWFWVWASRKWKFVAAAAGAAGGLDIIRTL